MDTTTVLAIIKMIDTQKNFLINDYEDDSEGHCRPTDEQHWGAMHALDDLQGHLQSYIEGQLSAAENQTEQ
jgi:hypothetical protein